VCYGRRISQGPTLGGQKMTSKCGATLSSHHLSLSGPKTQTVSAPKMAKVLRREIVRTGSLSTSLRQPHSVKPHTPRPDSATFKKVI
jgi:hypothetical protein